MTEALLLIIVTGCFVLQPVSTDVYLASIPQLIDDFHASTSAVQLTLSLFALGFGFAQLITGPVSDRFGRRPALIGGLLIYVVGSIGCATALSLPWLIICRVIQAIGCCTAVVVSRAIVRDSHTLATGAQCIARASSNIGLAVLIGPIVGAQMQIHFGWRATFFLHAILGFALLVFVVMRQLETNLHPNPAALALRVQVANYIVVARSPRFWAYALPGSLSYGALFVFISGASFSLTRILGVSLSSYGYCFSLGCAGYMFGSLICRRMLKKYKAYQLIYRASLLMAISVLIYTCFAAGKIENAGLFVTLHFAITFCHGFIFPCTQAGAVEPFPLQAGLAARLFGAVSVCAALIIGTIVAAILGDSTFPIAIVLTATTSVLILSNRLMRSHI